MSAQRNVELKARDPDPSATLAAALAHGAVEAGVLQQRDTYFRAGAGRLKLRQQRGDHGTQAELIAYERADAASARTSTYRVVPVAEPEALRDALAAALGVVVVVAKRRRLLRWRDVRIHLDEVEGLGSWVELEAVAPAASDLVAEHAKVAELRAVLGMADERVVAEGYAALLLGGRAAAPPPDLGSAA